MLDIILTLNTGFWDKGIIVMQRKKIMWRYVQSWLIFDIISSIPFNYILSIASQIKQGNVIFFLHNLDEYQLIVDLLRIEFP